MISNCLPGNGLTKPPNSKLRRIEESLWVGNPQTKDKASISDLPISVSFCTTNFSSSLRDTNNWVWVSFF